MKHRHNAIAATALIVFSAPSVRADTAAGVKGSLQALYNKASAAFSRKDADGCCEMYDPDCTIYTTKGDGVNLDAVRDFLASYLNVFQKVGEKTTIKSCTLAKADGAESAKVMVNDDRTAVIFSPQGKRFAVKDLIVRRDYWEKTDDGWKIKQSRIISDTSYINGKHVVNVNPSDFQ